MTMASSGSINMVGSSSSPQRSIAAELGVSAPISLKDLNVRLIANRASDQTVIMPDHFWGMAKRTYPVEYNGDTYSDTSDPPSSLYGANVTLTLKTDGTWEISKFVDPLWPTGNWSAPTATSVGRLFWVRRTLNSVTVSNASIITYTATTSWTQLSSNQTVFVNAAGSPGVSGSVTANYTIEIATDSSGSSIVSTSSITLQATAVFSYPLPE